MPRNPLTTLKLSQGLKKFLASVPRSWDSSMTPPGFRPQFFPAKSYVIGRWHWVKCLHLSLYAKCKHLSVGLYAYTVVSLLSPLSLTSMF